MQTNLHDKLTTYVSHGTFKKILSDLTVSLLLSACKDVMPNSADDMCC